jgi:predicted nucleic acid-binding protein
MRKSVYIESSIIGFLTALPSRDVVKAARQAITNDWWNAWRSDSDLFISQSVLNEISQGDALAAEKRLAAVSGIKVLSTNLLAEQLALDLVKHGLVPQGSAEDALHIAVAAANGMTFLLTWNFRHINNAATKGRIAKFIESRGYVSPMLCSPEGLGVQTYE